MKDQEIDEKSYGVVTIGVGGFWQRVTFAAQILFLGRAVFGILPENFIEEGKRPSSTTCILSATPEELMAHQGPARQAWQEVLDAEAEAQNGAPDDHVCIGDPPDFSR